MRRHGFRGTADQESAQPTAAVRAQDDPVRGPIGGLLENNFLRAGRQNGNRFRGRDASGFQSLSAASMASSVRCMAAARWASRCVSSAGISKAACSRDKPNSTALNTRISVPAGHGRAATDSTACCEPSDPSTASSTLRLLFPRAAGVRTIATEQGANRNTARDTLPIRNRSTAPNPRAPRTMRSARVDVA